MSLAAVRLGLVGAGRWGRIYIRALAAAEGVCLAAVASSNPETAALLPDGCVQYPDWQAMLAAGGLDGVIVSTPPATHAAITAAALAAGLPVLVEKPLTESLEEASWLRAVADEHDRALVMVDHIHLFSHAWRGLKATVRGCGPVRSIEAVAGNWGPYRSDASVLFDWGAHDISMCLDLLGAAPDLAEVRVVERRQVEGGMGEVLQVTLGFGAITARLTMGTLMDKTRRFTVVCERGTVVYDDLAPAKLTLDGEPVDIASEPPLSVAVREFAHAIRIGERDISGLDLGVAVVDVLDRCQATL